ncbi:MULTISPECIES: oligosaccharide flippase family protein [unclassified Campylobacter]|uniref:oligosaccharide flippase family protein n=1 Tax=unclassified Campylobacter TaxID=2593542 RepID=UPI0022E9B538|nr:MULTISPECIES: oligosaccharide flippase family protein [unclassified Campylobacter]MDA3043932.1 oligosaccharide flippase family protein [Campylobacter sp. JMF_09 ED2]MDA3045469.1 oligosaccharide flippase family protein [Campylobacter sp. JMF_07 ED4]MDA3064111.1 oligosaccharide flippase family protein [Campylobacter sp. JMF_11 EL3]MDA3072017.1 oligosaccharide flippase family protein [Campylobacter sp. VBCF_03 NA9]MDA3075718.1 oligosaccharide flippase family protein [Campylobacter sp. JMF_05 E
MSTQTINHSHKKRLIGNFASLTVLQIFSYVLPLLTLPYLVRVLNIETYGLVMFAQSFIIFLNIFVDWGFNLSATRDVSINRENETKLTEIYSSVMSIKIAFIFIFLLILTILVFFVPKFSGDKSVYYLSFLWIVGQALFPVWYFQGIEKMKYITIVKVTAQLIFTICIFVFVKQNSDYLLVPLFNGLGLIIGSLISLKIIHIDFGQNFKFQNFATLWGYFKESFSFFLSRLSVSLYTSANAFVLGLFTTNTIVGYYAVAEQLYKALQAFYYPLTQVLYPYIAKERNIALFKKIFKFATIFNIIGICILYFIGTEIFNLLFTNKIGAESIKVFNIFLVVAIFVVPSILLGYPFLGALGYAKYANLSVIYGSIIHVVGLTILAIFNNITLYSVAYMVLVTEIIVLGYRIFKSNNHIVANKQGIKSVA